MRLPGVLRKAHREIFGDPTRIHVTPPVSRPDRHGVAVVIIAKNEERHIQDWIRFHAIAGARAAIVYDNGSTDRTAELAKQVTGIDVTVIPWVTDFRIGRLALKRQPLAYSHAICTFGAAFRWMAFIDIDEYIVPVQDVSIGAALDPLGDVTNVSLPWTMFGPNGHNAPPDEPAVFAYETRARVRTSQITNYKCIVDPCDVIRVSTHKFLTLSMGAASYNDAGNRAANHKARRTEAFATAERLQLNHYYTFSQQELRAKMNREAVSYQDPSRRADGVGRMAALIDQDTVQDNCARNFLARKGITSVTEFRSL